MAKRWSSHTLSRLQTAAELPSVQVEALKTDVKVDPKVVKKLQNENRRKLVRALNREFRKGKYRCKDQLYYCRSIENVWRFARQLGAKRDDANQWRPERPYVLINGAQTYIQFDEVQEIANPPF